MIEEEFHKPKGTNSVYSSEDLLEFLVEANILGASRFTHSETLRREPGYHRVRGIDRFPDECQRPSSTTPLSGRPFFVANSPSAHWTKAELQQENLHHDLPANSGEGPPRSFFCPESLQSQEVKCHHNQGYMVMPSGPGPSLKVIEAELTLQLLIVLFHPPTGFSPVHQVS